MKSKIIIMLASMLGMSISCTRKVLDTQSFTKISEDVIWNSRANAETFIFSTYNAIMYDFASGPQTDPYTTNTLGFDAIYNDGEAVFTGRIDRHSDMGFNNWGDIRRCNMIISKVKASKEISESDKKELIAEGKFLRAMSYFSVARKIGKIVWIDQVLTPEDSLLLPSTKNPTESYEYIINDLEDAVQGLPDTRIPGRANKYVAAAMLSEVCLEALAYANYPNAPNINPSDPLIAKAIQYAKMVIDEGGYSLESEYGAMFNDKKPTSPEIIMGIYRKSINTTSVNTPMQLMVPNFSNSSVSRYGGSPLLESSIRIFEAWVQHGPTANLARNYLVIDRNDPSEALPWDQTSQFKNAVNQNVSVPETKIPKANDETSIEQGMIRPGSNETIWTLTNVGRDARWQATIISDSSRFYGETLTTCILGNSTRWMKKNGFAYYLSLTNMYWRKGVYEEVSPRIISRTPTDYHYIVTRLGRVYLNLAEAYLLKQDLANVLSALNMTRTVHGQLPSSTAATFEAAWTDYKRERRVELTLENDYYWSLLRWGRYGGPANHGLPSGSVIPELTETPKVMDISKDRKAFSVVEGPFFSSNNVRVFETRRYLFPIAQSYLDRNTGFGPQNYGW